MASSDDNSVSITAVDPNQSPYGTISPVDRDLLIRTAIGEAGNDPASMPGVVNVALNRYQSGKYGASIPQILFAPKQFESWDTKGQQLLQYPPDSPEYQQAAAVVDKQLAGAPDPTNGATKFYAPEAQAALGRNPPAWDDGSGVMIGKQKFFGGSPVNTDFLTDFNVAPGQKSNSGPAIPSAPAVSGSGLSVQRLPDLPPANASAAPPASQSNQSDFLTDFQVAPPTSGKVGQDGLVWDASGGRDPNTGELVIAGKPFADNAPSQTLAALSSGLNGIPVVGPYLEKAAVNTGGWLRNALYGDPQNQTVNALNTDIANSQAAYPKTSLASGVGGAIVGGIPAMAAAPAAFGLGVESPFIGAGLSGITGASIGAADAGVRSNWNLPDIEHGAELGGAFGVAGPLAAKGIGMGVNALSGLATGATSGARNVANVLSEIGMSPADAQAELARMGPNATLADVNPALTTEAGGLAAQGGAPTAVLKSAMNARAAAANGRVGAAVDRYLGQRPDLTATQDAIQQKASSDADPFYKAASATGAPVDVTPVLGHIDSQLPNASGATESILNKVKGFLTDKVATSKTGALGTVPKEDPDAILGARRALDDLMYSKDTGEAKLGPNSMRVAGNLRSQIDAILKQDPNIAKGDAAYAAQMRNLNALNEGTDLLKPGTRIEDVQRSLQGKSPAEVSAMRQGALSAIHDATDNARQGDYAAVRSLFAKSEANRAKLDALFPNSGRLFDALENEITMRGTEQRVAQGSATAERNAIGRKYSPPSESGSGASTAAIIGGAVGGGPGAAISALGQKFLSGSRNALSQAAYNRMIEGTARGLAVTGPEQQNFLGQVARAHAARGVTNALVGGGGYLANLLAHGSGNALNQYLLERR